MNYQVFPLLFTRITTLLLFFLALGLSFIGISSLLSFYIVVGVVFPLIISMRLHRLNETGAALTLTENSQWMTYIHGFPAQEQRSVLKNPCFFSEPRLRQFFIASFSGKLCLQIACLAILAHEAANQANTIVVLLVLMILLVYISKSIWILFRLITGKWLCESLATDSGSVWFQGFLGEGSKKVAMFTLLC